jgi:D-ribose pyranase
MKKRGVLNAELARLIAASGHLDKIVIGDAGLPVPFGKILVDLAVVENLPRFADVLRAVLEETAVEAAIVAKETRETSPEIRVEIDEALGDTPISEVTHEEFKRIGEEEENVFYIRTGETTPYANVILVGGVTF